jgi:bisphosphoglycerate-dependent phosphoglycerate mutase
MNDQLISKQQLQKRYGVCRQTILTWMRKYDLPVIEITQHRKYFRMSDVLKWEEGLMVQGKKPTTPVLD